MVIINYTKKTSSRKFREIK